MQRTPAGCDRHTDLRTGYRARFVTGLIVAIAFAVTTETTAQISEWCGGSGPNGFPVCGGACCTAPGCSLFPELRCVNTGDGCGCVVGLYCGTPPVCGGDCYGYGDCLEIGGQCQCVDRMPTCGNGSVEAGEECDDGNLISGDGCDANCRVTACGNGWVSTGEECDDGNLIDGDGCDSNCTDTGCGNGIVTSGEQCDGGPLCNEDCQLKSCGASPYPSCGGSCGADYSDFAGCVNLSDSCGCLFHERFLCSGSGVVTCSDCLAVGYSCFDLGDGICGCGWQTSFCANGRLEDGELCDDGNVVDGDGCDSNCTPTGCGNGRVTEGEECDDGNDNPEDGCKPDCTLNFCGDGFVNPAVEECDDGNTVAGDGCDPTCMPTGCGSGIVTSGEACDDGNLIGGDGCSPLCQTELFSGRRLALLRGRVPKLAATLLDPSIDLGGGNFTIDDPAFWGGNLKMELGDGAFSAIYPLPGGPAGAWSYIGRPGSDVGYRYRDPQLIHGPIKSVAIRNGRIVRIVGKGELLGHMLMSNPEPIRLRLTVGTRVYCASFGGDTAFIPERAFRARWAPVASDCP